jgi:hypothetical protein
MKSIDPELEDLQEEFCLRIKERWVEVWSAGEGVSLLWLLTLPLAFLQSWMNPDACYLSLQNW